MAHKKAGGSTSNGRDSLAKRRGVKRFGGQRVSSGEILVRQKGFWYRPGNNTHMGNDWTIHADTDGKVAFSKKRLTKFNGKREICTFIHVEPSISTSTNAKLGVARKRSRVEPVASK